ncbi:hypothetical protein OS493_003107 [Desmophyllum pertusum]|uniref:Uncharacterized protein n=1 Tax=Desmophyllum pertusum TaxID=174260 RepID=A0A9W9YI20_9CNID|nr:hypothetical protein OS493_003107 [Desmophyllum pertusum]
MRFATGKDCETLDGKWYNQLGSEIILKHENDGRLLGEYRTAVERHPGAAGKTHSTVLGSAPYEYPGAAFAFSVVYRNGSSTAVWTGQCLVCEDGHETLLTSWLLRAKVDTYIDKWKSTTIGRDTFTRHEQRDGPRQQTETNAAEAPPTETWNPDGQNEPCNLNGNWYNDLGSEMILKQEEGSVIKGEYRTAVERETGAAGTSYSNVLCTGQLGGPSSTFAFFVVWRNGASVTDGWGSVTSVVRIKQRSSKARGYCGAR